MKDELMEELETKLKKSLEAFKKDLSRLRTGVASVSLLEDIRINYYNQPTPINQVASLSVPDSRTVLIQPWDTSIIGEIEKAIQKSDLGVNPVSDGKVIRIVLPRLTEERRKELVKQGGKMLENARVAMRNVRREINEKLKKMEKDKLLSKDDLFKKQELVQKITDKYIEMAEKAFSEKEKEIMET
ncbi:MAG: ribosome recycling factor [Desulfobacterota bacterium]|nr:ribosome recycling factor [Thermodesulfobacteriota bacterium]MDW8001444.1 ribosome recycling factor [Deltaproteobacteria bacterium]